MKSFEEFVEESLNFRLGGSANKGAAVEKKFSELEVGDSVYYFCFENNKQVERTEYIVKDIQTYYDVVEFKFNDPKASLVLSKKDEIENYCHSWEDDNVFQVFTTADRVPVDVAKYLELDDEDI